MRKKGEYKSAWTQDLLTVKGQGALVYWLDRGAPLVSQARLFLLFGGVAGSADPNQEN